MSISVGVDAVTFNIARVLTSALIAGVIGVFVSMAGEKYKIPNRPLWFLVAAAVLGAALGAFFAGWASLKVSLLAARTNARQAWRGASLWSQPDWLGSPGICT